MSNVARTNHYHRLVIDQLALIKMTSVESDVLDVAFSLLFEQLVCAFIVEISELTLPSEYWLSFDRVMHEAEKDSANWILSSIRNDINETGHWLNQWRIHRSSIVDFKASKNTVGRPQTIQIKTIDESLSEKYSSWLSSFERLLENTRDLNSQY